MKQKTLKLSLTPEESQAILQVLQDHQTNYGTDFVPERILRIRSVINQLENIK